MSANAKVQSEAAAKRHSLSKSRFCLGAQCLKALWLRVHSPELAAPIEETKQRVFDQGQEVGELARKRYPGGILIESDHLHSEEALKETLEALAKNPPALFEAAFFFDGTLVRIDVLVNNGDGSWNIVEVKSSTKLKEEYITDIAIQRYVAEGAGLLVRDTFLKHLSRDCVFPDLTNLFSDVDCTEEVKKFMVSLPAQVKRMHEVLESSKPTIKIGPQCDAPYECSFKQHCWNDIPKHSVFELNGVWDTTKFKLYESGKILITDIPDAEKVSRAKPQQLTAVRTGKPVIDKAGLRNFLESLRFPIAFFDFETINPALPQYRGLRPYDQLPFQLSCHVIEKKGQAPKHFEYLADGTKDPRQEIASHILTTLGSSATILAYHASFEKARIEELASWLPSVSDELSSLLPRFIDLKDAFSKHYYHPEFHGSLSIKEVLPVMVPSMTYKGMHVANGALAQIAYLKICAPETPTSEKTNARAALLEYCKQDTFAMVKLYQALCTIVGL